MDFSCCQVKRKFLEKPPSLSKKGVTFPSKSPIVCLGTWYIEQFETSGDFVDHEKKILLFGKQTNIFAFAKEPKLDGPGTYYNMYYLHRCSSTNMKVFDLWLRLFLSVEKFSKSIKTVQ